MRIALLLLPTIALLSACGAPGAPVKPGTTPAVAVSGEARIGVTGTL